MGCFFSKLEYNTKKIKKEKLDISFRVLNEQIENKKRKIDNLDDMKNKKQKLDN